MTENIDKLERGALRALPEDSTEYSVLMARQCVSDLAALAREAEKKRIRDYGGHIHPLGHFCGSNCPMNPENAAARAREGETRAGSRGNATQDAIDHLARRVAELEEQATQDRATIQLREAERDEAEGKYVAEIVRHTRTEGRVAELEAENARLRGVMLELAPALQRVGEWLQSPVYPIDEVLADLQSVAAAAERAALAGDGGGA
jgi:hypothetical protein